VAVLAALFNRERAKHPHRRLINVFNDAYQSMYNMTGRTQGALIGEEIYYARYIPKGTAKYVLKEMGVWPPATRGRKRYTVHDMGDGWSIVVDRQDFFRVLHKHDDGSVWYSRMLLKLTYPDGRVEKEKLGRGCVKCRKFEPNSVRAFSFIHTIKGRNDDAD